MANKNSIDMNDDGDPFVVVLSTSSDEQLLLDVDQHPDDDDWEMVCANVGDDRNTDNIKNGVKDDSSCSFSFGTISFGTMGKAERILEVSSKEAILFEYSRTDGGCLTHFWFSGNSPGVEHTRIRYYVNDEAVASIDMELFMGHGIGTFDKNNESHNSTQGAPWLTKWMGKVGKRNRIHNNFRMPFEHSIRVTAERSTQPNVQDDGILDDDQTPRCWWYIRGCSKMSVSLGGMRLPALARLRIVTLECYTAQPLEEFDLCHIASGPGALFQVAIAAQSTSLTFLEACMRAYVGSNKMLSLRVWKIISRAPIILIMVRIMEILRV
jgi:hypothetical protein